jgi:hypothetical protein
MDEYKDVSSTITTNYCKLSLSDAAYAELSARRQNGDRIINVLESEVGGRNPFDTIDVYTRSAAKISRMASGGVIVRCPENTPCRLGEGSRPDKYMLHTDFFSILISRDDVGEYLRLPTKQEARELEIAKTESGE